MNGPIEVIGRSCRLPGANSVEAFWQLLTSEQCSVTQVDPDRFSIAANWHPRRGEKGKSYTFAAGVLDDIWGFDPEVFGISPREAEQMDPQQRLLLMLVWEALEDAGLPPVSLAGRDVGVFVGNSGSDHSHRFFFDPAGADPYMMTGNTGALISNRISHAFDWHGPSFTVDTACSSSLVALHQAVKALRADEVDTAIVAGVSLLLSPFPFIGFSAASMLSPNGLCRSFDEQADGYVRGEGGVVLVLQRADQGEKTTGNRYARIVETGVNSDGRTVGVALPSADYQAKLLEEVYGRAGVQPDDLAFIEAHGTGTQVGDPAEASAIGSVLGRGRSKPLPLGSVKSNIGHLEPASGIAGLLKAMLALEHKLLPASLHCDTPNPDIPFEELNIEVNRQARKLPVGKGARFAGVCNFGFGGANAHVILEAPAKRRAARAAKPKTPANMLLLSAQCASALKQLAGQYGERVASCKDVELDGVLSAAAWQRQRMPERLVVLGEGRETIAARLQAFAVDETASQAVSSRALGDDLEVCLVYAGNGSQWAGMGRTAFLKDESFAATFRKIDRLFIDLADWSLCEALFADDLADRLQSTRIAQPLLFALQVALTDGLRKRGLNIGAVLGHSVGEVAAAWAAGALSLAQAVKVIHARSECQESVRGKGLMLAVMVPAAELQAILEADERFAGAAISAVNSYRSVTVSGPSQAIRRLADRAARNGWTHKLLKIDYPFHNRLIDPVEDDLIASLQAVKPKKNKIPFYSTVTGEALSGKQLNARYWWDNVRQPVRFDAAMQAVIGAGCQVLMEIGPKPILGGYMNEIGRQLEANCAILPGLTPDDEAGDDPVGLVFARAIAAGASFNPVASFGPPPKLFQELPRYPWQNHPFKLEPSSELIETFIRQSPSHNLLGHQLRAGEFVWMSCLDTQVLPYLVDHKVDGKVILPGAAFSEMALEVARQWLGSERVELRDMEIMQPLTLTDDHLMEVRSRLSTDSGTVELASRRRLSDADWQIHATGRVGLLPGEAVPDVAAPSLRAGKDPDRIDELYRLARQHGIDFGPTFQRMIRCERAQEGVIEVVLDERDPALDPRDGENRPYNLHPLDLDACFHGINLFYDTRGDGHKMPFIPVRLGRLRIYRSGVAVRCARLLIRRSSKRSIKADCQMFASDGGLVATLSDVRLRAAALVERHVLDRSSYALTHQLQPLPGQSSDNDLPRLKVARTAALAATAVSGTKIREQHLLLEAAARRSAYDVLFLLADEQGRVDISEFTGEPARFDGEGDDRQAMDRRLAIASNLLAITEQSGLAEIENEIGQLSSHCPLPPVDELLKGLLAEEPRWMAECVLLNRASHLLPEFLSGRQTFGEPNTAAQDIYSPSILEQLSASSPLAEAHIASVAKAAGAIIDGWPSGRPLRVLELGIGSGGLTRKLLSRIAERNGTLTAADSNKSALNRLAMSLAGNTNFDTIALASGEQAMDKAKTYDLLVSANGLHLLANADHALEAILPHLASGALSIVSTSETDTFSDLVYGPVPGWFDCSVDPMFPLNPMRSASEWGAVFQANGFGIIETHPLTEDLEAASLILARFEKKAAADRELALDNRERQGVPVRHLIALSAGKDAENDDLAHHLQQKLKMDASVDCAVVGVSQAPPQKLNGASKNNWLSLIERLEQSVAAVDIVCPVEALSKATCGMDQLSAALKHLSSLLQVLMSYKARLWIVAPGGARAHTGSGEAVPLQCGIWAFGRTAMNEYADLDIRLVDASADLDTEGFAARMAALLAEPGDESELVLTADAVQALRIHRGLPDLQPEASRPKGDGQRRDSAVVLTQAAGGSLDHLEWKTERRRTPEPDQVQIEVSAAGLNFRDVMWAQGMLPEEALEDGSAGATLGFECAGRVCAIGAAVDHLQVGDPVMAMAPSCFASHVTVTGAAVIKLPPHMDLTAAATIPVAFLTAYYALHHLARLEEDEWVLIHGAAGGVGLAALQVAKWRKAKVIATAGSEEKRDFLKMLGADHVLNTRTLDFVDEVGALMAEQGLDGVDVVLNSLAGEAMERSIELVRPFGRFLELGKRDFYANTKIGLRPFRQNLSYFGIDADQLFNRQPKLCKRLFGELTERLERGTFAPLPYRRFASGDVTEAFRLMQKSGHIGKIVVEAPAISEGPSSAGDNALRLDEQGAYIIVGGLGGFGLETARWLADRGARHIVLTGRSGRLSEQAERTVAAMRNKAIGVEVVRCDVADRDELEQALAGVRAQRPIKGIIHAAMVLEDELIRNMTADKIDAVLRPKVQGADNLDQLTAEDRLDHFILFSSVAALFGNPGQGPYVAANAYLNALARQRRAKGLPALAVGWGAITDVGVLARQKDTANAIARHTGGLEFKAGQALELLGQFLARDNGEPERAEIVLAAMNWNFAGQTLPIMRKPAFGLVAREVKTGGPGSEIIDFARLVAGLDREQALEKTCAVLTEEISAILRVPVEDINLKRSLTEIGLDSLMKMELGTAVQHKLNVEIPIGSIVENATVTDLAGKMLAGMHEDSEDNLGDSVSAMLIHQHVSDRNQNEDLKALVGKVTQRREHI